MIAVVTQVNEHTGLVWTELLHQASGVPAADVQPWLFGDHADAFASLDALTLITPAAQRCQCGSGVACTWEPREGQNPVSICVRCGLTR
jgi:hypothetical protein